MFSFIQPSSRKINGFSFWIDNYAWAEFEYTA